MTEQTQPTDAELIDVWAQFVGDPTPKLPLTDADKVDFARAVLAKWGTPAGVGEPWGACISGRVFVGKLPEHARKLAEADNLPIQWLYTTPQPTQAQAGAGPLTRYRVLEPRVDRIEADDEYLQDDAQTWATDQNGTFVGTIYGYALRAARRRIKGADHG